MISIQHKLSAIPYKIIIIGDSAIGKSTFLLRATSGEYDPSHKVTIGVDYKIKFVQTKDGFIKLKIWDTAGQERFRSIIRTYYNGAHGIILMFDLTNMDSFENLNDWMEEIYRAKLENCPIILIGSKSDLKNKIVVSEKEIQQFINTCKDKELSISYFEISSKNGKNIQEVFSDFGLRLPQFNFERSESEKWEIKEAEESVKQNNLKHLEISKISNSSCCNIS